MNYEDFDVDAILAEFREENAENINIPESETVEEVVYAPAEPATEEYYAETDSELTEPEQVPQEQYVEEVYPQEESPEEEAYPEENEEEYSAEEYEEEPSAEEELDEEPEEEFDIPVPGRKERRAALAEEDDEEEDYYDEDDEDDGPHFHKWIWTPFCFLLTVICLVWGAFNLNPASGSASQKAARIAAATATPSPTPEVVEIVPEETDNVSLPETVEPTATPEPTPVPTPEPVHYTIPADAACAPAPRAENFVVLDISQAGQVMDVIQQAREDGLLGENENMAFSPDVDFYYASDIRYYYDETILTICWKEVIDGNTCSFCETKIADASQFRRKLADDTFGGGNTYYASDMSRDVNAVTSMNADYYLFRDFGIVVYNGELYRFNTGNYTGRYSKYNCVDTLFVDNNGDFHFKRLLEENTWESIEQYIAENNINFSISFGPVLVDNYELQYCEWYPVGEIDRGYSRAGIGQMDTLHYLYMGLNHSPEAEARWNINTFGQHFWEKGVRCAYALDGGQTGEVLFNSEPYNHIDYGAERLVSDIIYFGTALPEEG